ncbi:Arm DNA-binding domain-containing protein [Salinisphaera aquimarina]|uniref:Arm DNA-binding domain-containing protein n=1 Tax=Salinisphaera aquimarina TaxID=2094031 RepID=A0ABV7EJJ6_9GAMM
MVNIRSREDTGKLFFDFKYRGMRCREYTALDDTKSNRKRMKSVAEKMDAEITLGTFAYRHYFPDSRGAARFDQHTFDSEENQSATTPLFRDFADTWWLENEIRWRRNTQLGNRAVLNRHLLPAFGDCPIAEITKADVLAFRAEVAKCAGRSGNVTLSPKTINNLMGVFNMIMTEAADRFEFPNPVRNIKRLRLRRKDIQPFSLDEVRLILDTVRSDYKQYFTLRFFTGMRTGELHGLKWSRIDWEARQVLVRETVDKGVTDYTKTDGSQREIAMSSVVYDALRAQHEVTGQGEYVFVTRDGTPLDTTNVTQRVWYPLLRHLQLAPRRPYHCRHTAATLWLAAGENPEWIARQMGHTTTEMLFRVYSRYVPNLTRRDGSAFDRFVTNAINGGMEEEERT